MRLDEASLLELLADASDLYRPSPYWEPLVKAGVRQLGDSGFENFKRTVNMKYFNWNVLGIMRHQFLPVLRHWLRHPDPAVLGSNFPNYQERREPGIKNFNPASALIYRLYVAMLWEYVAEEDSLGLFAALSEPTVGNPFLVYYKGRATSQDLCNSVHEFYRAGGAEAVGGRPFHVVELGAGYGRLGFVFLKALPQSTYCVIDIPPALNLAQEYLRTVFPGEIIFAFRRFHRYEDVQDEFESARIRFLAAHQIELLPPKQVDLVLNISALHEMTSAQIRNYLQQIDRICGGRFYTKQWRVSRARVNGFVVREMEYPIPTSWKCLYHRRHPIQRMFFEALYQT